MSAVPIVKQEDIWASSRLVYRSTDLPEYDGFWNAYNTDAYLMSMLAAGNLLKPRRQSAIQGRRKGQDEYVMAAIICLKPSDYGKPHNERHSADWIENEQPKAIGMVALTPEMSPGRNSSIGLSIMEGYRSQGYGSEAIKWTLKFAFEYANLHRVRIDCFEYNVPAHTLYKKLGFKEEGSSREYLFFKGRYWDEYHLGMLDREWFAMQEKEKELDAKPEEKKLEEQASQ